MASFIKQVTKKLLYLLFPPKCVLCGKILAENEMICENCKKDLPLTSTSGGKHKCEFIEICVSPFYYRGKMADAIKRYKFSGKQWYSEYFASAMVKTVEDQLSGKFDLITWVPISKKRLNKRGYNQSELLAKIISAKLEIEAAETIIKTTDTPPQSKIKGEEKRRANVLGAYKISGFDIEGRRILIIDDIITTGSTISECARTLLMGGAEIVYAATIASAKQDKVKSLATVR